MNLESGRYQVQIGENARDICLEAAVSMEAEPVGPAGGYTLDMPMGEFSKSPKGRRFLDENIEHMIRGMAMAGFIPKEMLEMADRIPGGISLDVIDRIAQHAGNAAGGTGGLQVLMGQPLSILNNFLPEEKKEILADLLKDLSVCGSGQTGAKNEETGIQ